MGKNCHKIDAQNRSHFIFVNKINLLTQKLIRFTAKPVQKKEVRTSTLLFFAVCAMRPSLFFGQ
jgi:hypothetical protein